MTGDYRLFVNDGWDMLIGHPDCTYLCSSGLHWNKRVPGRQQLTNAALDFVREMMDLPIAKIAIENPIGCISTQIRRPDQIIQPYEFGDDASKRTCLWLKGLPPLPLDPAARFAGRHVIDPKTKKIVERWSNQTDSGQNRLGPSDRRAADRAVTYAGIARAMADTWG